MNNIGMTTKDHLSHAVQLLEKPNGWVQGTYESHTGGGDFAYCAVGAVNHVLDGAHGPTRKRVLFYLANAIAIEGFSKKFPKSVNSSSLEGNIIGFNDEKGREKADVINVFNRALSNAKRRHPRG